jgi:ABC-type antimicrobial peptide transport system permease subunit
MALLMAAVGIYGVISYTISRRTSEIGLRMALGTSQTGVLRMVLRETVVEGIAIGLPCAIAAARLPGSTLARVSPADSLALTLAVLSLARPLCRPLCARDGSRADPVQALRGG